MIITSMNLYEYSENNNREMGVLIQEGSEAYKNAHKEVKSILKDSIKINTGHPGPLSKKSTGFCTFCSVLINFDPKAPYCTSCLWDSIPYSLNDRKRTHCHICGDGPMTAGHSLVHNLGCRECAGLS